MKKYGYKNNRPGAELCIYTYIELELQTQRLVILNVKDFPIQRHWHIVQRSGKRLSPVAVVLKQFALDEAVQFIRLP